MVGAKPLQGVSGTGRTRLSTQASHKHTLEDRAVIHTPTTTTTTTGNLCPPGLTHPHVMGVQRCELVRLHFCVFMCVKYKGRSGRKQKMHGKQLYFCIATHINYLYIAFNSITLKKWLLLQYNSVASRYKEMLSVAYIYNTTLLYCVID